MEALIDDVIRNHDYLFRDLAQHISSDDLKILRSVLSEEEGDADKDQQHQQRTYQQRLISGVFPTKEEIPSISKTDSQDTTKPKKSSATIAHYGPSFTEASFRDPR